MGLLCPSTWPLTVKNCCTSSLCASSREARVPFSKSTRPAHQQAQGWRVRTESIHAGGWVAMSMAKQSVHSMLSDSHCCCGCQTNCNTGTRASWHQSFISLAVHFPLPARALRRAPALPLTLAPDPVLLNISFGDLTHATHQWR